MKSLNLAGRRLTVGRMRLIYPIESARDAFTVVVLSKELARAEMLDDPNQNRIRDELNTALDRFL